MTEIDTADLRQDQDPGFEEDMEFYEEWREIAEALRESHDDNVEAMCMELDTFLAFVSFQAVSTWLGPP